MARRGPGSGRGSSSKLLPTLLGFLVIAATAITVANYGYYHQVAVVGYKEPLTKGQGALETPSRELPTPSEGEQTVSRDHSQGGISNNADAKIETTPQTPEVKKEVNQVSIPSLTSKFPAATPGITASGTWWSPPAGGLGQVGVSSEVKTRLGRCDPSAHKPTEPGRPLNKRAPLFQQPSECPATFQGLCQGLRQLSSGGEVVVCVVAHAALRLLSPFLDATHHAAVPNLLLVAADEPAANALEAAGLAHYRLSGAVQGTAKWLAARDVLAVGCAALLVEPSVALLQNPFHYLFRDSDVETMSLTSKENARLLRGRVVGIDDAAMGWSRYAQTMSVAMASSSVCYLSATHEAYHLAQDLASSSPNKAEDAFNQHIFMPAGDGVTRPGVSTRVMLADCFGYSLGGRGLSVSSMVAVDMASEGDPEKAMRGAVAPSGALRSAARLIGELAQRLASAPVSTSEAAKVTHMNDIITSAEFAKGKESYHQYGCNLHPRTGPTPRPLNMRVAPTAPFPPREICSSEELGNLCDVLYRIHVNREVLVAVSNKNIFHMLGMYIEGVRKANVSNAMVVALDEETGRYCRSKNFPYWVRTLTSRSGGTDNHATSGLKFQILRDFMKVGASVALSDVDIVWVQNPFEYLYRDADVEGMTDGWDDVTAYGWEWASATTNFPEPVAVQRNQRLSARNSGLFFLQATEESLAMMNRLAHRMATEDVWDQTAYNEEQFYVSYGGYRSPGVSQRVMNYMCFMNSKLLFRYVREDPELYPVVRPVSVHVNYHPEKPQRMVDILAQYHGGKQDAIGKWHWGVGLKGHHECAKRVAGHHTSALARRVLQAGGKAEWGGIKFVEFLEGGQLKTPWGNGRWGVMDMAKSDMLYADFVGAEHQLQLKSWPFFESTRCSDGEKVKMKVDV